MKKLVCLLLLLTLSGRIFAQTEEKRTFSEVKKMNIAGGFDITFTESENVFVQFKSETEITSDKILTTVKGDELFVSVNDKVKPNKLGKISLIIGYKKLKSLEVKDFISLNVKNKLDLDELELKFGGETQSTLDLKVNTLTVEMKDKASLKVTGECKNFEVTGKDDSFLTAPDFICENIEISVKGKGSFIVNPVKSLEASLNGTGEIVYKGQPKKLEIDAKGGGVIKPLQ